jgi:hypothetical protein
VTSGARVGVTSEVLHGAFSLWWAPEYPQLVLEGRLGNALPGSGLLGAPVRATVRATVRDPDHAPYCTDSPHPGLRQLLTAECSHEEVLAAIEGSR